MTPFPLEVTGLTKRFGSFLAVHDVSLQLGRGEILGFLGPNGAGKSTSLRMALGIMEPDEGQTRLFGDAPNLANLRRVGFLPEERGLYKRMSARDIIIYFGQLKGMKAREAAQRADELLGLFGLEKFRRTRIMRLSKGMAQKVQILTTLVHRPDVLILDEPFSGLDPVNQTDLETLLRAEHARGASILFSTHVMEHAERLCDRIVMMAAGRKMFDGSLNEAFETQAHKVKLAVPQDFDLKAAFLESVFDPQRLSDDQDEADRSWWEFSLPSGASGQDVLKLALEKNVPIEGFDPGERRLRDVFVSLVREADETYGEARHG